MPDRGLPRWRHLGTIPWPVMSLSRLRPGICGGYFEPSKSFRRCRALAEAAPGIPASKRDSARSIGASRRLKK